MFLNVIMVPPFFVNNHSAFEGLVHLRNALKKRYYKSEEM